MPKSKKQPAFLLQAVKYVEYWAPRLRLENWLIEVVAASDDFEFYALAEINVDHLRALITVRDPKKVQQEEAAQACNELEVTVVHELIHVRFAEVVYELDGNAKHANEQATEMTAIALVAARRGVHPRTLAAS